MDQLLRAVHPPNVLVYRMTFGYLDTQAIHAFVNLDLPDMLDDHPKGLSATEIAKSEKFVFFRSFALPFICFCFAFLP
jgi:hypothetical protein